MPLQRRIDRNAPAQHWRRLRTRDRIRDLEHKMRRRARVVGISAIRFTSVAKLAVKGIGVLDLAVVFLTVGTHGAVGFPAGIGLGADADAVADSGRGVRSVFAGGLWTSTKGILLDAVLDLIADYDGLANDFYDYH